MSDEWQQIVRPLHKWELSAKQYTPTNTADDFWQELCRIARQCPDVKAGYELFSVDIHSVQAGNLEPQAEVQYTFVHPERFSKRKLP